MTNKDILTQWLKDNIDLTCNRTNEILNHLISKKQKSKG